MRSYRHLAIATALVCVLATDAAAEVRVEGNVDRLRLSASGDALSDVLSVLSAELPVRFRTAAPLAGEVKGAFAGPLNRVIARLLSGHNYVIRMDGGVAEIIVFGPGGEIPVASKMPVAGNGTGKGVMSRWR